MDLFSPPRTERSLLAHATVQWWHVRRVASREAGVKMSPKDAWKGNTQVPPLSTNGSYPQRQKRVLEAKWTAFEQKRKQGGNMAGSANCKLLGVAGEQDRVQRERCRGRRRER